MKTLTICTYNVLNDNLVENLSITEIKEVYHAFLKNHQIDVLCTQEMISSTVRAIEKQLKPYRVIGKYRYGNSHLLHRIKSLEKFNEGNQIITRLPVLTEETEELPWFPRNIRDLYKGIFKYKSLTPRIVTESILEIEDYGRVRFLNTHLDCHIKQIKALQLNKIKRKVRGSMIPVVLTGDFNTDIQDKIFIKFIEEMKELGLKRIEYNHSTFKKRKKASAIDHIFIPNDWEVKEIQTVDDDYLEHYSDHYPLVAEVIPKI